MLNECSIKIFLPGLFLFISGCLPLSYPPGVMRHQATISNNIYTTQDGASLPLRQWLPKSSEPKAVLIALHGFNDYSNFFEQPGKYFSEHGLACYAYDQRGFGFSPNRGRWAGISFYTNDLVALVNLLKLRHPQKPIYLLGESMGGAVVIAALAQSIKLNIDGVILAAPALWARETMPWYQTSLLWTLAHTMPWLALSGDGVKVQASDNIEMLRELGRDPLIIKKTRVEAIYGLTDLMDVAYSSAKALQTKTLILYGEKDEIIPKQPTYDFLRRFLNSPGEAKAVAIYSQGYHMLLRDLQASVVWNDILSWTHSMNKLPSGAEHRAEQVLKDSL